LQWVLALFATGVVRMAFNPPSTVAFQQTFARDFPYGTDVNTSVVDSDITSAFQLANMTFNPGLFGDQGTQTTAYLYLSAHFLVLNLRASSQGINGQYPWLQTAKAAGSVSEGFQIPQRILDNPVFAMLAKTNYGARYLEMVLPKLAGQVLIVCGGTQP
jgi:hypothetical protein